MNVRYEIRVELVMIDGVFCLGLFNNKSKAIRLFESLINSNKNSDISGLYYMNLRDCIEDIDIATYDFENNKYWSIEK